MASAHGVGGSCARSRLSFRFIFNGIGVLLLLTAFVGCRYDAPSDGGDDFDTRAASLQPGASAVSPVRAVRVVPSALSLRAEATGRLAPWRRAEISPDAGGLVVARPVREGSWVASGATLLQLRDDEARLALAEAEAQLLEAQVGFAVLARPLDSLRAAPSGLSDEPEPGRARSTLADSLLAQAERAHTQGRLSRRELQAVRRRHHAAELLSGAHRDEVTAASTGLTQAEQQVERARIALARTRMSAPFSGEVADLRVEVGEHVRPGEPALTLLDITRLKVEVEVLEDVVVRLREGTEALVRIPALGELTVRGRVLSIAPYVDAETGMGRVTVAVPNPEGALMPGLHAAVEFETERRAGRLVVPVEAVLTRQERPLVFRVEDGRAQWTHVRLGERSGDLVEVTEGISPGDTVLVGGHFALAHGAAVRVERVEPVPSPE